MKPTLLALLLGALSAPLARAGQDDASVCRQVTATYGKQYAGIECLGNQTFLAYDKNLRTALMDGNGKITVPFGTYPYIYTHNTLKKGDSLLLNVENGDKKEGVIDGKGNVVVPFRYDSIGMPQYGDAQALAVYRKTDDGKIKSGLIAWDGTQRLPFEYDGVFLPEKAGDPVKLAKNTPDGKVFGLADENGRVLLPPKYFHIGDFSEGLAVYSEQPAEKYGNANDKARYGYLDRQGGSVIAPRFKAAYTFVDGVAWADEENGDQVLIDRQGAVQFRAPYRWQNSFAFDDGIAAVKQDGQYGLVDKQGKTVIPFEYDDFYRASPFVLLRKGNFWGASDVNGKVIVPFEYDDYTDMRSSDSMLKAQDEAGKKPNETLSMVRNGRVFVFDREGKQLSDRPAKFAKECTHLKNGETYGDEFFVTDVYADEGLARVRKLTETETSTLSCTAIAKPEAAKTPKARPKAKKRR